MGVTSRVRTWVLLSCAFCVLAVVLIGGLGVTAVGTASTSLAQLADDELATATITAELAHEVDGVYASSLLAAGRTGQPGPVTMPPRVYDAELPAVERSLGALERAHEGDPVSELSDIARLGHQWVRLRAVVNRGRPSSAQSSDYVGQLRSAYGPLGDHLAALVTRESVDAGTEHARAMSQIRRIRWGIAIAVTLTSLAFFLLCLLLVRLLRRAIEPAQEQVEFADTLQLAGNESEAHGLLQRYLERLVEGSRATVFNRNNSADRLEAVTEIAPGSALLDGLMQAEPRACLAVRSARVHDQDARHPALLGCSVCAGCPGVTTCAPLTVGGEVIGSVLVNRDTPYGPRERGQIRDAVAQAAPVLANLRNLAIAEVRASTDSLTGLPNKRAVTDSLNRMLAQASRALTPLSLLLLDLDHFKALNDGFGHPIGDQVLANVGAALRSTLREGDFAGRNGGEEFLIVLPDTDVCGALSTAEKVRAAIEEISIPGLDLTTTVSIGIASYPDHAATPDRLERLADAALYLAKRSGRNRVEVATSAGEPTKESPNGAVVRVATAG